MCISVLTTTHPRYPFILISNRDEFLARPTARANWWDPPHSHVLGGRDLQRPERGTWLGITKQGRIAILTNFREEGDHAVNREKSRGGIVNAYLYGSSEDGESEEAFAERVMREVGLQDVGGFTLVFGKLKKPKPSTHSAHANGLVANGKDGKITPGLAILSNRTQTPSSLARIATTLHETHGVSNSHYGDRTWPKVVNGETYLDDLISKSSTTSSSSSTTEAEFIESLFAILCSDSLPRRRNSEQWEMYVRHMRNSIMIPPAKGEATTQNSADDLRVANDRLEQSKALMQVGKGAYGTSKQSVILVDWEGKVVFVERTLYDQEGMPVPQEDRNLRFEFEIEGWND